MSGEKKRKGCAFCGQLPLTAEHVWPDWIGADMADVFGKNPKWDVKTSGRPPHEHNALEAKVKRVCKTCNGTWMSDIENAAKPTLRRMMRGERDLPLTHETQLRISTWAVKTALMANFLSPKLHYPGKVYAEFFRLRQPDEAYHSVRTTAYIGANAAFTTNMSAIRVLTNTSWNEHGVRVPVPVQFGGAVCTLRAWRVIFQVMIVEVPRSTIHHEADGKGVHRIWPRVGSDLLWPPGNTGFDDESLRAFTGRAGTVRDFHER